MRAPSTLFFLCGSLIGACGSSSGLSTEVLDEHVAAQQGTLQECVAEEEETLLVRLEIAANGQVSGAVATLDGEPVEASECVEGVVRAWTFPEADQTTAAELPLTLRPTGPAPEDD